MIQIIPSFPKVSVLMATYNNAPYLRAAIDSILNQTFTEFEFIIVNDASTDETTNILDSYDDSRIVRLENITNMKLAASLNHGLEVARGDLIVRMDSDDMSLPERLAKQVGYMETHPEIGILGTQWTHIGLQGKVLSKSNHPVTHGLIMWTYLTRLAYPLTHATVIMRRELIKNAGGYNTRYPREQDGELFLRLINQTKYANLPDILYKTRATRSGGTSLDTFSESYLSTLEIRRKAISQLLNSDVSIEELKPLIFPTSHRHRQRLTLQPSFSSVTGTTTLLLKIFCAMDEGDYFTHKEREFAQNEIGYLISNMLCYCEEFVFQASDTISVSEMMKHLRKRTLRNLLFRLNN